MQSENIGLLLRDQLMPCQGYSGIHPAFSFAKKTPYNRLIKIDVIKKYEYRAWHDDIVMDYLGDVDDDENLYN